MANGYGPAVLVVCKIGMQIFELATDELCDMNGLARTPEERGNFASDEGLKAVQQGLCQFPSPRVNVGGMPQAPIG
jgi:hypothetical protein